VEDFLVGLVGADPVSVGPVSVGLVSAGPALADLDLADLDLADLDSGATAGVDMADPADLVDAGSVGATSG
jgi:hypothetical protein